MQTFFSRFHNWQLASLLLLCFIRPAAVAQVPAWGTVVTPAQAIGNNSSSVYASAVDAAGNVYLTGVFKGTVSFGNTLLTAAGGNDVFVAKWSPAGTGFVWAQQAGGTGEDESNGVALVGTSIFVTGSFDSPTIRFGSSVLANADTSPFPTKDAFVAKLTDQGASGVLTWAQRAGGADGDDNPLALAVEGSNVYITGYFRGPTASFGGLVLANANPNTGGAPSDVFVAKLTDSGTTGSFAWAKQAGGPGFDQANGIAVEAGRVVITGSYSGATSSFETTTLTNATQGYDQAFVAKLWDAGSSTGFEWAKQVGSTGNTQALNVAINGPNVYIAGYFYGAASFATTTLTSAGDSDGFVAKLFDAGNTGSFAWARRAGGAGSDGVNAMAVRGASIYITGWFNGLANFGPTTLTSVGSYDVFVAKIMDAGGASSFDWAQAGGGTGSDTGNSVVVSNSGAVYVSGIVTPPATFGAQPVGPLNNQLAGFLTSLQDGTGLATTTSVELMSTFLFPNPAHGRATIQLPPIPGTATATLTLLDALGRTLRTQPAATNTRAELDLTGLPAGLYAVRVQAGGSTATRRLIVD